LLVRLLAYGKERTYLVSGLLFLVALLIGRGLGLVGDALLLVEGLPPLSENLANLTYAWLESSCEEDRVVTYRT
jgi:hypothetical protein